jgi:hypothetical protein
MSCVLLVTVILFETLALQFSSSLHAASSELSLSAQGRRSVSVTVQPPAAIQIVLFASGADGKALTTTDQTGKGSFDNSALANLGGLAIVEETCAKSRRVLLVASSAKAPQNRDCKTTQLGTFAGSKEVALNVRLSGSFTAAIGAVPIPEPPQATPSPAAVERTPVPTPAQASRPPVAGATAAARPCPPGASMVGAKLDLSPDADSFEKAPLLVPCVYRGVEDTDPDKWKYYKLEVKAGQTLRVTARLRDSELPPRPNFGTGNRLAVRVHDGNGGVSQVQAIPEASGICELEYKAKESGFAFVSVSWVVRDAAFQISVQ